MNDTTVTFVCEPHMATATLQVIDTVYSADAVEVQCFSFMCMR